MIPAILYIAAQILSDIGSLKIVTFMGLTTDAGTLIYPLTFTLRDLIHKSSGRKVSRIIILIAAAVNLFMALYFWVVDSLPGYPDFGLLAPVWRIVIASIIAEVVSEFVDTEIYHFVLLRTKKHQWLRVLFSNVVAIPIDTLLFVWLAFGGVFPAIVVWEIFFSNILIKILIIGLGLPLIYLVRDKNGRK